MAARWVTLLRVLWFSLWFLVILKIPILYLGYVMWWAVKDPPEPGFGGASKGIEGTGGGPSWEGNRRRRVPSRQRGPHGSPVRRPARTAYARAGSRSRR